ncbi:hypothetical protein AMJ47_03245 [Parcubacteria bacterium DG_72]|nr:MAG: hypothetical protein AMJ47_03245 [Parcubacteria bacterium DG_72]
MQKEISWHSISGQQALEELRSNPKQGLSHEEVIARHMKFGKNLLPEEKPLSKTRIFLEQFKSPLMYILVIAGVVVLVFKEYTDAVVIFGAILLNSIVGFFQENKASDALRKLKKVVKETSEVIREGNEKLVDSSEIVPGDILVLNPGDKVGADARIVDSDNLKINEMALTGEWLPAEKRYKVLKEDTPLADRDNMVYMGTIVEDGKGKAVVVATGSKTEIGEVAQLVKETKEEETPLQRKLSHFAKIVGALIIFITGVIFFEGILTGNSFLEMFTVAVAVSVAAIPEGLPVAMTVILALGMQNILRKRGLVRRLSSAETLGSCSVIATDKTGTLTQGKMQVAEIEAETKEDSLLALKIAVLCNEAFVENPDDAMDKWIIRGRPTDKALLLAGIQAGINKKRLESKMLKIGEIPFSSKDKFLVRAFLQGKNKVSYIAGAPEKLLKMAGFVAKEGKKQKLSSGKEEEIRLDIDSLSSKGLRVVGVGFKDLPADRHGLKGKDLVNNLVFVGLIALKDPIRREAKKAIKTVQEAGMKPIMVTGDHKLTAKAVAQEIGLKATEENIMEGKDLDKLSVEEFKKVFENIQIYARVEPEHKMRIVQAWQEKGEVIAMTGDGINDAPALKKADIGVALGSGTEVAKEVSDLVLLSDNFNVIVAAVEEGRSIIDNIRKVITYLLSDSFTETILIGLALLFGFPLPVTAAQILWVNLIEDGLPDIALAFEPKEKDIMKQKPKGHNTPLLNSEMKVIIFIIGIITDIFLFMLFWVYWKFSTYSIEHIRTIIFVGLALNSLFYVFSCKSLRQNLWHINPLSNKFLVYAWVFGVVVLLLAVYLPPLQSLLKTEPLFFSDWMIVFSLSIIQLALIEITKYIFIVRHKV